MILPPPGFCGEVPARGDFIARRVSPALAGVLDPWLAGLTVAVRAAARAAWPEAWLTAPLWHFALGGALAPAPGAAGVLVASMDRVGRCYPFVIVGPAGGVPDDAWADAAEALALAALDDAFDPDALDAALVRLGPPPAAGPLAPSQSLWRCRGSDRVAPTCQVRDGLPDGDGAVGMVLGVPQAD